MKRYIIGLIFLLGCGATIDSSIAPNTKPLRNYNKIYVNIVNSSGAISMSTISSAELGMGSQHLMQGDNQTKQALESFQFELMKIGFQFVGQKSEADAFVEFTIGQIRYDPITGWIADQATARIHNSENGQIIAYFKTEPRFITPTVKTLVEKLSTEIMKKY